MAVAEIDKLLVAAITAAKNKPHNFAILSKGPTVVHVIVDKKPIKVADITKAKKEHGATAVTRGVCVGEPGSGLVFQVAVESPVPDSKLKEFIARTTKLSIKPRFEVTSTAAEIDEEEEEGSEDPGKEKVAADKPAEAAKSPVRPTPADATAFTTRLAGLKGDLDTVRSAETSVTAEVKAVLSEIVGLAANKKFVDASLKLGRLSLLVKTGMAELASKTTTKEQPSSGSQTQSTAAQSNATDPMVALSLRIKPIKAKMDAAMQSKTDLGGEVKVRASEMAVFARKKDYAAANRLLDQIELLLDGGPSPQAVAAFQARREKIEPSYLKALKADPENKAALVYLWDQSAEQAQTDVKLANVTFDRLEKALQPASPTGAQTTAKSGTQAAAKTASKPATETAAKTAAKTVSESAASEDSIAADRKKEIEQFFKSRIASARKDTRSDVMGLSGPIADQVEGADPDEALSGMVKALDGLYDRFQKSFAAALASASRAKLLKAIDDARKVAAGHPVVRHLGEAKAAFGADPQVLAGFHQLFDEAHQEVRSLSAA